MRKIAFVFAFLFFLPAITIADEYSVGKFLIIKDQNQKVIVWPPPIKKHIGEGMVKGAPIRTGIYCKSKKHCVSFITNRNGDGSLVVLLED